MKAIITVGVKFNNWTVLKLTEKTASRQWKGIVECSCGKQFERVLSQVINGYSKMCRSCSSLKCTILGKISKIHGDSSKDSDYHKLYVCWKNMKARCYNEKSTRYSSYGGSGIRICDEWLNDYSNFKKWAINNNWETHLTIDRIDVYGDYAPSNCRWIAPELNVSLMSKHHALRKTGGHSTDSINKRKLVNTVNSGIKCLVIKDEFNMEFQSAKAAAEFLANILDRDISSVYSQVKQCLNVNNNCETVGGYYVTKQN